MRLSSPLRRCRRLKIYWRWSVKAALMRRSLCLLAGKGRFLVRRLCCQVKINSLSGIPTCTASIWRPTGSYWPYWYIKTTKILTAAMKAHWRHLFISRRVRRPLTDWMSKEMKAGCRLQAGLMAAMLACAMVENANDTSTTAILTAAATVAVLVAVSWQ